MSVEKLEVCPNCGEGGKRWYYDFQRCEVCGHDGLGIGFKPMQRPPDMEAHINALLAEKMTLSGWRPIDTAPKDGSHIILARWGWWTNTDGLEPGSKEWCDKVWRFAKEDREYGLWWIAKGFWSDRWKNWNDGVEPSGLNQPTHWTPIPPAPEPADA